MGRSNRIRTMRIVQKKKSGFPTLCKEKLVGGSEQQMEGVKSSKIILGGKHFLAVSVPLKKAAILLMVSEGNPSTFIACGYIDVNMAEKWGDSLGIVTGVKQFEDML